MPFLKRTPKFADIRNHEQRNSNTVPTKAYAILEDEDENDAEAIGAEDVTAEHSSVSQTPDALQEIALNQTVPYEGVREESEGNAWKVSSRRSPRRNQSNVLTQKIPDGNWRDHASNGQANTRHTTRTRDCHSRTQRSGYTYTPGPRTRSGVPFVDQNPGIIVWHWDVRPCLNRNLPDASPHIIPGPDGSRWLKKGRFWLIISRFRHRVSEIPIYSYDNKGLEQKPREVWWEYVSLKPSKIPQGTIFKNQSPENPVIEIVRMTRPDEEMRVTMVANFTEVITRDIDVDDLRVVAVLSEDSKDTVLDCVKRAVGNKLYGHQ